MILQKSFQYADFMLKKQIIIFNVENSHVPPPPQKKNYLMNRKFKRMAFI